MFTGIILAKGRVKSLTERDGDLELGVDAAGLDVARIASATASASKACASP